MVSSTPKMAPRWFQEASGWPKIAQDILKRARERPRKLINGPRWSQDEPEQPPDGRKKVPKQRVALVLKLAAIFEVISSRQSAWQQFNNLGTSSEKPRFGRAARQSKELKKKPLFWPRILVQKTAPEARSITSFIKQTVGWGGPRGGPEIRTVFVCFF